MMVEGPMNIEPKPLDLEVETVNVAAENIAKQETGLTDVAAGTEAEAAGSNSVHFPVHAPRLYAGGQKTLNALRPHRG